jgi:peptidoglycan/LPS O-acetylase OafA/YrhL
MKKKIYFENLDGLRFLCFLSVFFFHSFYTEYDYIKNSPLYYFIKKDLFGNGNLGVNFFFVLSGFLITYLLIEEKKLNQQIDLKNFWTRRILRIWPLFYFCVIFGFWIFPYLKSLFGQQPNETASIWYYLTFTNNFDFIKNGPPDASTLGVLWSVAIEEQFYLIWPVILYFSSVKNYWIAFSVVIIGSLLFRLTHPSYMLYEFHTFSCIGDMAIGASGAWIIIMFESIKNKIENFSKPVIALIYLVFLFYFFFKDEIINYLPSFNLFDRVFVATNILFIILEQNYAKNSFFKMSNFKLISNLGKISYGLYCLHFIGILIATTLAKKLGMNNSFFSVFIFETVVALTTTIIISQISFRILEAPFLKIKDRFAYIIK